MLLTLEQALAEQVTASQMGRSVTYEIGDFDGGASPSGHRAGRALVRLEVPRYLARDWIVTLGQPNRVIPTVAVGVNIEQSADVDEAFAIVIYGSGGITHEVRMDWRQGSTFRVFGSNVEVRSFMPTAVSALGGGAMTLGASISPAFGGGSNPFPQTFTQQIGTIANLATSADFAVPRFARQFWIMHRQGNPSTVVPLTVEFFHTGTSVPIAILNFATTGSTAVSWQKMKGANVPTRATIYAITNPGAAAIQQCTAQFDLAF